MQQYVRRVVIDSAFATKASTASAFQANTTDDMEHVRKVCIAEAMVISASIGGTLDIVITHGGTPVEQNVLVTIPNGRFDASFGTFVNVVRQLIVEALDNAFTSATYDNEGLDRISITHPNLVEITSVSCTNPELLELMGWSEQTYPIAHSSGVLYMPSFRPWAWPRICAPVHVHIDQVHSEQQGAGGHITQVTSKTDVVTHAVDNLWGARGAVTHVVPKPSFECTTSHAFPCIEFSTPLSKLARLDIKVMQANGTPYPTPRVFLALDVYCDRK